MDLIGKIFGRLTVISKTDEPNKSGNVKWNCKCSCGNVSSVFQCNLIRGFTKSCGCLRKTVGITHGKRNTPAYSSWDAMIQRCNNPNHKMFKYYGERNINVCKRWMTFENFYKDMGDRPDGCSLDRRDNDGDYEPGNCRWATQKEQVRNRSVTIFIEIDGIRKSLPEWCEELGLKYNTVLYRLRRGWSEKKALGLE